MDFTFVLFRDKSHAPLFLNYLNRQHSSINFTMETEEDCSLSFLDVDIKRNKNKFSTSVYRKPTFSGLGISYFSFCSYRFKIKSITTLLHRASNICSNFHLLHHEFLFLRNFFVQNGFPELLVQSKINKFLNSKYERGQTVEDSPKDNFFISLPYFGLQSEKLKLELTSLLNKYFENIKFKIVLVNKQTIGGLFQYKDTLDKGMASAVVYKYCCPKCGAHYVGSTCRRLDTRAAEHAGVSVRTGLPLSNPSPSHIREHFHSCGSPRVSLSQFDIIGRCSNIIDLRILESLHILKNKPKINASQTAYPLYIVNQYICVFNSVYECFLIFVCIVFFVCIYFIFFSLSLNFQYTKKENHFKLVIIYYSFCVLADDAISNLAKRPYIRVKSEDRHAAYCFEPGPSLYPETTLTKHCRHYKIYGNNIEI